MSVPCHVLNWLLDEKDPSVRYRTLTELLEVPKDDNQVIQARCAITNGRKAKRIFGKMHPDGYWLHRGVGAGISYAMSSSTHFVLSFLAELGFDREDGRVARAVERYLGLKDPDCDNPNPWQIPPDYGNHQSCLYAHNLRTFSKLGYHDDPRIERRLSVLLDDVRHDGGYLCNRPGSHAGTKSCIRGSVKALMAFAQYPELWEEKSCLDLVQYFLNRNMLYRSDSSGTYVRGEMVSLTFPFVISVSLLELAYAMSVMGYGNHPGMQDVWKLLEQRMDEDGRYPVDWYPPTLFTPGPKGKPNKWVTLYVYLSRKYRN